MAYWNNDTYQIEYSKPERCTGKYKGWQVIDCGCCNGFEWTTSYEPRDCKRCGNTGYVFQHIKSGVTAEYPGGRFV